MKEAIKQTQDGVILDLDVSPGAKETAIKGYNPWRKRIEIRLSERAEKGKANDQLVLFLSDLFGVNSRNIRIMTGLTNSRKSVKITGLKVPDILKILAEK